MVTTGKMTQKRYKCTKCGYVSLHLTNHYGEIYPKCVKCGWKYPLEMGQVHVCLEKLPEGWERPPKWKMVKLGDVAKIENLKKVIG